MKKLKITALQKKMLESVTNAKMVLSEGMDIPRSKSPSAKVTKSFSNTGIKGFTAESTNEPAMDTEINWNELITNVHEFLKQIYTNPTKEGLSPYWETIGVEWDELIQMLTAVDIIKSVSGGYRLTKVVDNPAKAVKIVGKLVEKLVKDKSTVVDEVTDKDISADYFKRQIGEPKKSGKSRTELLAAIAAKRAESQKQTADFEARRDAENKTSMVDEVDFFDNHPEHPANQNPNTRQGIKPQESGFNIMWYHQEIAILEKGGKYYAYNVDSADMDEYEQYASREETPTGRDEDGFMDVEHGDWDLDGNIIDAYVNDNYNDLSFGAGLDDWENGVEMVEITSDLAQDLTNLANYIKGSVGQKLLTVLSSINIDETTTGSVGGSYVGKMGDENPINKSNVASELKNSLSEDGDTLSLKNEIIGMISPFVKQDPESSLNYWLRNEGKLKIVVDKIQTLGNDEWMLMIQFIVKGLQSAEMFTSDNNQNELINFKHALNGLVKFVNHFTTNIGETTTVTSAGGDSGTFAYDAPVGDGSDFWNAGNKLNKRTTNESFHGVDGKPIGENNKAFTDTQYPNGGFVEFDDCTKLNNSKKAQNGGCSAGSTDNVVKYKGSKNSVISNQSIYEEVAKATGRSIEEVKNILNNKNDKTT